MGDTGAPEPPIPLRRTYAHPRLRFMLLTFFALHMYVYPSTYRHAFVLICSPMHMSRHRCRHGYSSRYRVRCGAGSCTGGSWCCCLLDSNLSRNPTTGAAHGILPLCDCCTHMGLRTGDCTEQRMAYQDVGSSLRLGRDHRVLVFAHPRRAVRVL